MTEGPAIVVSELRRRMGEVLAVDGMSFHVERGELFGLVGPDGAGKTTTVRMLAGLLDPEAGQVSVLGLDPTSSAVRERVGLMPQQFSLYGDLSVGENLRFFGQLFCIPKKIYRQRADRLLHITRLADFTDRPAQALSGGMYKKLALACALLHEPEVLLLDEPTNGVDPVSRRELWELLYEFVGDGMAVLVSTPYMDEAARCHRVGLAFGGRLLDQGPPSDLVHGLALRAFFVEGGEPAAVNGVAEGHPAIRAASPAGPRLRVVVAPGDVRSLEADLSPLGARLRPTALDFEDLYLARMAERSSERAASQDGAP